MNSTHEHADIIVIGSGGCGLAAAVTASEGNAKVIVFEKQRSPGIGPSPK
jgi:succinate dehydrogenase/fumarate reductase flavoprotein subunit